MHSCVPPLGENWVEVIEIRLSWLQSPLPTSALTHSNKTNQPLEGIANGYETGVSQ